MSEGDQTRVAGQTLVDAIGRLDWPAVEAVFAADAVMYASTPSERRPLQELSGAPAIAARLHEWFEAPDELRLESSVVERVTDEVTRVAYRFAGHDAGGWWRVEQTAYLEHSDDGFRRVTLSCSGFRDIPSPT